MSVAHPLLHARDHLRRFRWLCPRFLLRRLQPLRLTICRPGLRRSTTSFATLSPFATSYGGKCVSAAIFRVRLPHSFCRLIGPRCHHVLPGCEVLVSGALLGTCLLAVSSPRCSCQRVHLCPLRPGLRSLTVLNGVDCSASVLRRLAHALFLVRALSLRAPRNRAPLVRPLHLALEHNRCL